jgi:hypothetical protein
MSYRFCARFRLIEKSFPGISLDRCETSASGPIADIAPHRRRLRARRQLRLRPNPSWDEQQLARSLAALHVGMGPGRIRQWIFATNPDSELPFRDPVKQLR